MRAAQLAAPRTWQLLEVDKPKARDGQMLVRMERVAVCGTDKPSFVGISPSYPVDLGRTGHEGLGIVESCPTSTHQPGDRVLLYGADRGLFQEYVLAPPDVCIGLPQAVEPEIVLMSQLLGTVIHCFYKLGNVINQDVVVLGQGSVGQLFNATLRNLGAKRIIGVDPLAYRLDVGRRMGATHAINPEKADVAQAVAEITGGKMADLAVEAVGKEATFNLCGRLLRHSGTLVYFGVPNKENLEGRMTLRFMEMFGKELRIVTSVGPRPLEDYSIALDWIVQGRLDVRPLVSHVLPFEEIQKGFEMAFERPEEDEVMKVVLRF
jgi:2-desacetyl-2-hydroxyethyl bacteriochlorophyllide A dehydrogenase